MTEKTFTYKSTSRALEHTIAHNLNDYCNITTYVRDEDGWYNLVIPSQVKLLDFNTTLVTFNTPLNCVVKFTC